MMPKLFLLFLLLIGVACDSAPIGQMYVAVGTVRNVWCHAYCDVSFEHDNGTLQELTFDKMPPVWAGLHCKLTYEDDGYNRGIVTLISVERQ